MHNTHLQVFISLVLQGTSTSTLMVCIVMTLFLDCQRHLSEPELKLMDPVVQLLCGMTSASDPAAVCVIPCVIPRLLKQYSLASHVSVPPAFFNCTLMPIVAFSHHTSCLCWVQCSLSSEQPLPLLRQRKVE